MKKILFVTGTRADYGKLKPLMSCVEKDSFFQCYVFVSGMHLLDKFGYTYKEVLKDGYQHIHIAETPPDSLNMSINLGNAVLDLSRYLEIEKPDLMVVHGDRIDALAGAIAGALNNILVAHVEGGEVSGTIDESIRHAISKFAHIHFTCNEEASKRLVQLGENPEVIFEIGSPDIDIMLDNNLPSLESVKCRYEIEFEQYSILMYHPVTTEYGNTEAEIQNILEAIKACQCNCIVIYPNNDLGSQDVLKAYQALSHTHFKIFPSLRFEYFLTLMKHATFIIGNSSAGIRESGVYGVPAIDIGSRQKGRYSLQQSPNIQHVAGEKDSIVKAIKNVNKCCIASSAYGKGNSTKLFMKCLKSQSIWNMKKQKEFIDIGETL